MVSKMTSTPAEHLYRLSIFFTNYKLSKKLKLVYKGAKFGLTEFSALSYDEFKIRIGSSQKMDLKDI